MKIIGYRCLPTVLDWKRPIGDANGFIASGVTETSVIVIETDSGVSGISLGSSHGLETVFPAIEGEDPRAVSSLYDRMVARVFKSGHYGPTFGGIGAFDMALWDLKAKLAGEPLWRLLGGRDRFVPGYASGLDIALDDAQLHAFYHSMAERGFSAGKLKGGLDVEADIRRLKVVEDALGGSSQKPTLMLDANESWNLKQAVRYVSRIEREIDLAWIEEPLRRWDSQGLGQLSASVRAAVATGENLTGLEQFQQLMDNRAADIVQTGAVWGITHMLRVSHSAHARELPISAVGLTSGPSVAHAATAIPNHLTSEVQSLLIPTGVFLDQLVADGGLVLGDEAGAGITFDESLLRPATENEKTLSEAGPHVRPERGGLRLEL